MVNEQKHLSACSQDQLQAAALASTVPPVDSDNGFAPVLSAPPWKESVNKLTDWTCVCWSGITTGFGENHSWQHPFITHAVGKLKKNNVCFTHTNVPCVFACASSLFRWSWWFLPVFLHACFHGLLDRSRREEAEVRIELMRWKNTEAQARRKKSGTFVLVCVIHLSRIRLGARKTQKIKL